MTSASGLEAYPLYRLARTDPSYPVWLPSIADPPAVLYVRGQLLPGPRYVACVGTRQPSLFGQTAAQKIAGFLAKQGWSIVSGLALGVDTRCHEAALAAGGHTVAVLANGLDTVYPAQNRGLAERILAAGGALLSEQPLGTTAIPRNLIARDRLQSGMSAATIVMQTDLIGGTMHTVRFAVMQNRPLVAPLPQGTHAKEPKSRGILALTQLTGTNLVSLINTSPAYAERLTTRFADRPVARALTSREDFTDLLHLLEDQARKDPLHPPAPQRQLGLWGT